jgi:hypothetical protein
LRQAYDYWQDQPGNYKLSPEYGDAEQNEGILYVIGDDYPHIITEYYVWGRLLPVIVFSKNSTTKLDSQMGRSFVAGSFR